MVSVAPEQGQLVEVRQRHYVVIEVAESGLPPDAATTGSDGKQHLVTLSSVEDDGLGEELQIVWQLEPGARVYEKMELPRPTDFDDPATLDCFLDAVRWGAVVSADSRAIQSPFRSGVEIEEYQLDPVVRAIQMPRVNLLIADDTGLGKTIEAGLVAQELMIRNRARTILIACPASLQNQWRDQMHDKFGLDFRVVDTELFKDLRRKRGIHVNPWQHFPRLITSIDFLKRERPLRLLRELLPAEGEPAYPRKFDLLIVDEAHNVAPSGSGYYATDSLRTAAIRLLSRHFEHKLFLSATPHNGYQESFTALLELLDNQRFARGVPPDPKQLGAVMIRRLKSELPPRWDGTPRFTKRTLEHLEVAYTDEERQAHKALQAYTDSRMARARTREEEFATGFVLKLLKKRLFSSPAAFESTLAKHVRSLNEAKRKKSKLEKPSLGILRKKLVTVEEDYADDDAYEQSTDEALDSASKLYADLTPDELKLLDGLQEFAHAAALRPDTKARMLLDWLHGFVKPKGKWSDERVLIFTEYRATQKWLQTLLAAEGLSGGGRLEVLYGGMPTEDRDAIKNAFQADAASSPVRILLATDAASEGIDLQNHCYRLVHYEIPWNPNRLEQRNGRVDRYGQKNDVLVYHFVGAGYDKFAVEAETKPGDLEGDAEFLMRAAVKVNNIREDLGKVGPVIAHQIEEAMLGLRKALDTAQAEADAKPVRQLLKIERDLREQIQKLSDQVQETRRELRISPENIRRAVEVGLAIKGHPPLQKVAVKGSKGDEIEAYHLPPMAGSWSQCHIGLAHPHTHQVRPLVFDDALSRGRDDVVLAHLNHRLVQMCLRLLRAEIWSSGDSKRLNRVTARLVEDKDLAHVVVVAHGRLVVLGGDNHRVHEELISAGGRLREGRFARLNVGEVNAALAAALSDSAPPTVQKRITEIWQDHWEPLVAALEARMRDRTENLQTILDRRAEREAADIAEVLKELERNIRSQLEHWDKPVQTYFEGWSTAEVEQFQRNKDSIHARLAQIPGEIEKETEAIRRRYADPSPRLFPVAVTYLLPKKIARTF